jgi:hypothetical protein
LAAVSCLAVGLGLTGCGDRITATRTFTSTSVVSYSTQPATQGFSKNLDGTLKGSDGAPIAGSRFHEACFSKGQKTTDRYTCTGYVKTGSKAYAFTGSSLTVEGTFASLYAGSRGRVVIAERCCIATNSQGQEVHPVGITLKP